MGGLAWVVVPQEMKLGMAHIQNTILQYKKKSEICSRSWGGQGKSPDTSPRVVIHIRSEVY